MSHNAPRHELLPPVIMGPSTITAILEFANGGPLVATTSLQRLIAYAEPSKQAAIQHFIDLSARLPSCDTVSAKRDQLRALLAQIAQDDCTLYPLELVFNTRAFSVIIRSTGTGRSYVGGRLLRGDPDEDVDLVPRPESVWDVLIIALVLGRIRRTPAGDRYTDRISRCQQCRRFYLLPTRKPSKFCSRQCRRRYQ